MSEVSGVENANKQVLTAPPKKRGGCLLLLLKILLVLFLIVGVIVGVIAGIFYYKGKAAAAATLADMEGGVIVMQYDYADYLAEASDIEGLTRQDKIEMGLSPMDNADTDEDGLTDQEEIEVYGSDPTLFSTAGDMFGDGYKVANGLDVQEYLAESQENALVYYNEFDNLTPCGESAADVLGVFEEVTWDLGGIEVYQAYRVYDFNGTVTIDFSDYLPEGEFSFFVMTDGVYKEVTDGIEGNSVTVAVDSTQNATTIIGISEVYQSDSGSLFSFFSAEQMAVEKDALSEGDIIVMASLAYYDWAGEGIYVFEGKNLLAQTNTANEAYFSALLSAQYSEDLGKEVNVIFKYLPTANITVLQYILSGIQDAYDKVIAENGLEDFGLEYFYTYAYYPAGTFRTLDCLPLLESEETQEVRDTALITDTAIITSFDVATDALPFPNISTYLGTIGNCAGFAEITARLFNGNLYSAVDTLPTDSGGMSYDISDAAFATFFDKGLSDYQSVLYYRETYPNGEMLDASQITNQEDFAFIEFMGAFLTHQNDVMESVLYYFGASPSYDIIEAAEEYLKNNQILTLAINAGNGGHAVNVYGIEYDQDDPDKVYLLVYDCNLPNDTLYGSNGDTYAGNCKVEITKKKKIYINENGVLDVKYQFDFCYQPVAAFSSYRFCNTDFVVASSSSTAENVLSTLVQMSRFQLTTEDGTDICPQ
ncbi:MAG: hypothetical protein R3Y06_08440 [Faecalibacterium sp.]